MSLRVARPGTGLQARGVAIASRWCTYDSQRVAVITWGAVQLASWRFLGTYMDEAWAVLSSDMLAGGKSPQGLNIQQLQADLAAL